MSDQLFVPAYRTPGYKSIPPSGCGSFRDQGPTDSSNPAEDLTLRVNRHSAYPVGAERIPYLR